MALFRSSNQAVSDESEDYDLSTPEEILRRRRHKRAVAFLFVLGLLGVGIAWGGKPAYRGIRAWQARRIAGEAWRAMDVSDC